MILEGVDEEEVVVVVVAVAAAVVVAVAEEGVDMKIARLRILSLILMILIFWSNTTWAESAVERIDEREYILTVLDNAKPILLIEIRYQGKAPKGDKKIKQNWRAVDTDFYHETFTNLAESAVHIKEIRYSLDRGPLRTPRIKSESKIKATYGATKIMPNKSLYRENAWVWAKKENVLHRIFVFSYKNREIEVDIPLVYQRK